MNILISLLQILLGLWHIIGGVYMAGHYQELINEWASGALPSYFWVALGVVQILLSLGLTLSVAKKFRKFVKVSTFGLAAIDLLGIGFYSSYTGTGMLWAVIPAVLLVFVAYGKSSKK